MSTAGTAKAAADTTVEVGRVFESGGIDGLILYALLVAVLLVALLGGITIWALLRSIRDKDQKCHEQAQLFAKASLEASEALKDVATAIASAASADITFKQTMASFIERAEVALARFESRQR